MIDIKKNIKIGYIKKKIGYKGQFIAVIDVKFYDVLFHSNFIFLMLEGLLVPFKIEELTEVTDEEVILKVQYIDSVKEADNLKRIDIYIERCSDFIEIVNTDESLFFKDFSILNSEGMPILKIESLENFSGNLVFICNDQYNNEILLPANKDLFEYIDEQKRIIKYKNIEDLLL